MRSFRSLSAAPLVGAGLILSVLHPVSATTLVPMDLVDLSTQAELVVTGWVTSIEVRRGGSDRLYTYVTLENLKVLHGAHPQASLVLRLAGGELRGERQWVAGMPEFSIGERALLFVRGNGREMCPIVGWGQGRFRVVTDPDTGADYLTDGTGSPVIGLDEGKVRFGSRPEATASLERAESSAGTPDVPGAAAPAEAQSAAPPAKLPLARFLQALDKFRQSVGSSGTRSPGGAR